MKISNLPSDWEEKRLRDVALINSETIAEKTNSGHRFYYQDLSSVDNGKITPAVEQVRLADAPSRARRKASLGDLVMSTVRPYLKGFARVDFDPEEFVFSTGFAIVSPKCEKDSEYIYQNLFSGYFDYQFYASLVGSSYPALNSGDVEALRIPYPRCVRERISIGEILRHWDLAIESRENLISQKQVRMKGLMQKLVSGEVRFSEFEGASWREQMLSDQLKETPRKVKKPDVAFKTAGVRCHARGIFAKPDMQPDEIALDELFEIKAGDVVVNISFAWEHAIAVADESHDGALVSHRFPTFVCRPNVAASNFFKYFVRQPRMRYDLKCVSPGGAGRNRVLNKTDFKKLRYKFPGYEEQIRIGSFLDACSEEITLLEKQLELLKEQKKSLMQKLLTGKVRVKV